MSLNDEQYKFLRQEGFDGALPDMWQQWLLDLVGSLIDSSEVNDLWLTLLHEMGYEGALPDMWRQWLLDNGYTDSYEYWRDVVDGIAPAPGLGFNGTYAFYPFATNGDNTAADGTKINTRLSDKNAENDAGQLLTVPEYTTFFTGSGELDEPSATNILIESNKFTANIGITLDTDAAPAPDGTNTAIRVSGLTPVSNEAVRCLDSSNVPIDGIQTTTSLWFKGEGTDIGKTVLLAAKRQGGGAYIASNTLVTLTDKWKRHYVNLTGITDNLGIKLLVSTSAVITAESCLIAFGQAEVGTDTPSSYIPSNGAPFTRDSDKPTVPTGNAWVDPEFYASDNNRTDQATPFVNGIRRVTNSTFVIQFNENAGNSTGTARGKYFNQGLNLLGSILRNDPEFTCVTAANNSPVYSHNNRTEQELIDLFGNDGTSTNRYPIAFHYSVYGDNQDLAGVKQLRSDVGDLPPTVFAKGGDYTPQVGSVTGSGSSFTVNGTYADSESLLGTTISGSDLKAGQTAYIDITVDYRAGVIKGNALFTQDLVQGNQVITVQVSGDIPTPIEFLSFLAASGAGAIDADIVINSFDVKAWLDWPTKNFTTSFKFTPKALTGAGDAIIYVNDTANSQGYYCVIPDSNYDAFELIVFEGANLLPIAIPILGGINIDQEYSIDISITDSTVYFSIDGDVTSVPNTITFAAGNLDAKIPLAGSSEAVYTCKIADLECKDYQP